MQTRSRGGEGARRPVTKGLALAGVASLALAGCVTVPNLGKAPQTAPVQTYATAQTFEAPAADWPSDRWWTAYGDAQLDQLIDEALAGSPRLAEAQARGR